MEFSNKNFNSIDFNNFQIFINSERYATYAHRLDPHEINGLQIGGDLEVSGIQMR